ncbi:MAG TPA: helix-turn-helix domain-containing protein [Nocardioides sp.]|jgi:AcrR family transcriptional regulator|nr:helix-turn-helix domain-containing protein [Nocardioides sp.]
MWAGDQWQVPMPVGLAQDLAWSTAVLASEHGLGGVTFRALARHARMAPGTITNHYRDKAEVLCICTSVIGRWLSDAGIEHVYIRGPIGLFPTPDDYCYRVLISAWAQLEAASLNVPEMADRVRGMAPLLRRGLQDAFPGRPVGQLDAAWRCLARIRLEVLLPGSDLSAPGALALLEEGLAFSCPEAGT